MGLIGKKTWLIPDMYWPEITSDGHYVSHESISVLNTSEQECKLDFTLYYEHPAPPISGFSVVCAAQCTHHIRMDLIIDAKGVQIPRGVAYAAVVKASIPVVVQYTRVDTTQCANSMMTTMAYAL